MPYVQAKIPSELFENLTKASKMLGTTKNCIIVSALEQFVRTTFQEREVTASIEAVIQQQKS